MSTWQIVLISVVGLFVVAVPLIIRNHYTRLADRRRGAKYYVARISREIRKNKQAVPKHGYSIRPRVVKEVLEEFRSVFSTEILSGKVRVLSDVETVIVYYGNVIWEFPVRSLEDALEQR